MSEARFKEIQLLSSNPVSTHPKISFLQPFFLLTELRFELQQDIRSRSDRREWVSDEANPRCGFARNGGAKAGGFLSQTRLAQKTTRDATRPFKAHPRNQARNSRLIQSYRPTVFFIVKKQPKVLDLQGLFCFRGAFWYMRCLHLVSRKPQNAEKRHSPSRCSAFLSLKDWYSLNYRLKDCAFRIIFTPSLPPAERQSHRQQRQVQCS